MRLVHIVFIKKIFLNKDEPVTKPLALGKAVYKAIKLKIQGAEIEDAIAAAEIEGDFHPEVTYEELLL